MKFCFLLTLLLCLMAPPVDAKTVQISAKTTLTFDLPEGWVLASEPPVALLEDLAAEIGRETRGKDHQLSRKQLLDTARDRLSANAALLYNPESKSYLALDLSPLRPGEPPPDDDMIRRSARYAGESLANEKGVIRLSRSDREIIIPGCAYAYRFDIDYLRDDRQRQFSGVVGFSAPYWCYFYFTDTLGDPQDRIRAEQVFRSLRVETRK